MYLPKQDLYTILLDLKTDNTGLEVYQSFPDEFKSLPCITFSVNNNAVETDLSNNILYQNITITIDIWGETSSQCSSLLSSVESLLRQNYYKMTYSADVPNTDKRVRHIASRFTLIK